MQRKRKHRKEAEITKQGQIPEPQNLTTQREHPMHQRKDGSTAPRRDEGAPALNLFDGDKYIRTARAVDDCVW